MRQWKLSPTDLATLDKWDDYTEAKEAMFFHTDTGDAPVDGRSSATTRSARAWRRCAVLLSQLDYPSKDTGLVGVPDPLIVGPAAKVHEDDEDPARFFPSLDR